MPPPLTILEARVRGVLTSWGMALALLFVCVFFQWKQAEQHTYQTQIAFRRMLEKQLLAYEAKSSHEERGTMDFPHFLVDTGKPEDFDELIKTARRNGIGGGWLDVDCAILFLYFADESGDSRWNTMARELIGRVHFIDKESFYGMAALRAVRNEALSEEERAAFERACRAWPRDWWVVHLARMHRLEALVDVKGAQQLGELAIKDFAAAIFVECLLCAVGVIFAWWAWKLVRLPPIIRPSSDRVFRLWPPKRLVFTFALTHLVVLVIGILVTALNAFLVRAVAVQTYATYFWSILLWGTSAVGLTVVPVFALRRSLMTRWFYVRRALGMESSDFFVDRFWIIGATGAGLLFMGFGLLDTVLARVGVCDIPLDGLSRSMDFLGGLELPVSLMWGCVIAPFVEETVFRGFFFNTIRVRWGTGAGMVTSSALFAILHVYGALGTFHVFVYGMVFCWVSWKTRKIAASMIMHACVNAGIVVLNHLGTSF